MFGRIVFAAAFFAFYVKALNIGCDISCSFCAYVNDSAGCTVCKDSAMILFTVNGEYGYCSSNCSSSGGFLSFDKKKCYIGGMCPPGSYLNNNTCSECSGGCKECSGGGSGECLSCKFGKILSLGTNETGSCIDLTACPSQKISKTKTLCTDGKTTSCPLGCSSCYGNYTGQCTNCSLGIYPIVLLVENYVSLTEQWGSCGTNVNVKRKFYSFGFDPGNTTFQYKCHWTCQTCIAENDEYACSGCGNGAYLNVISSAGGSPIGNCKSGCRADNELSLIAGGRKYCSSTGSCPYQGTYVTAPSNGTKVCNLSFTCDSSCSICNAPGNDSCIVCNNPLYWLKKRALAVNGTCEAQASTLVKIRTYGALTIFTDSCPSGFDLYNNFYCKPQCGVSNCQTCGSSNTSCWECKFPYLIQSISGSVEGLCTNSTCDNSYSLNDDGKRCSPCHSSCATCSSKLSPGKCASCLAKTILEASPPSFCGTSCGANQVLINNACVVSDSHSGSAKSDNNKWYVGVIVIGSISLLTFFVFLGLLIIRWFRGQTDLTTGSTKEPNAEAAAKGEANPAQGIEPTEKKLDSPKRPQQEQSPEKLDANLEEKKQEPLQSKEKGVEELKAIPQVKEEEKSVKKASPNPKPKMKSKPILEIKKESSPKKRITKIEESKIIEPQKADGEEKT